MVLDDEGRFEKKGTEALICAAQGEVLRINYIEFHIYKTIEITILQNVWAFWRNVNEALWYNRNTRDDMIMLLELQIGYFFM